MIGLATYIDTLQKSNRVTSFFNAKWEKSLYRTNEKNYFGVFPWHYLDEWDNMFIVKLILASMHLFLGLVAIVYLFTTKPTK